MNIARAKTKTEVITITFNNIIKKEKINKLLDFHSKIDLKIDLNTLRKR